MLLFLFFSNIYVIVVDVSNIFIVSIIFANTVIIVCIIIVVIVVKSYAQPWFTSAEGPVMTMMKSYDRWMEVVKKMKASNKDAAFSELRVEFFTNIFKHLNVKVCNELSRKVKDSFHGEFKKQHSSVIPPLKSCGFIKCDAGEKIHRPSRP